MARDFAGKVYAVTARFPRHEDYGLRSQMNRAVNSVGLNIAEGSGKSTSRAFDYHLEVAVGSAFEVVAASLLAMDRGYIVADEQQALYAEGEHLARSINSFRRTLNQPESKS